MRLCAPKIAGHSAFRRWNDYSTELESQDVQDQLTQCLTKLTKRTAFAPEVMSHDRVKEQHQKWYHCNPVRRTLNNPGEPDPRSTQSRSGILRTLDTKLFATPGVPAICKQWGVADGKCIVGVH